MRRRLLRHFCFVAATTILLAACSEAPPIQWNVELTPVTLVLGLPDFSLGAEDFATSRGTCHGHSGDRTIILNVFDLPLPDADAGESYRVGLYLQDDRIEVASAKAGWFRGLPLIRHAHAHGYLPPKAATWVNLGPLEIDANGDGTLVVEDFPLDLAYAVYVDIQLIAGEHSEPVLDGRIKSATEVEVASAIN